MLEGDAPTTAGVFPADCLGTQLVADYQTRTCLQASFRVVGELFLPGVDLRWADVEAGLLLAPVAELRIDHDEGFRVLGETDEAEALVDGQLLDCLGHG